MVCDTLFPILKDGARFVLCYALLEAGGGLITDYLNCQ